MNQTATRDTKGHFVKGRSGNPAGRPCGLKNRPKQQDRATAATWPRSKWRLFYRQALHAAHGNPEAAAFETAALYVASKPPPTAAPGRCPECGAALNLIAALPRSCAFPMLGTFVHWACAPYFAQRRFAEAAHALKQMGIDWPA